MDKQKATPKDFFLWLGALITMYGSVIALITLLFEYINYTFPDPLEYYVDPYSGSMRFAMATLMVLVPVAVILMRFIRKDIALMPEKNDLWVRRWALVLTVFLAAAIVVGDLIALFNSFLGGDLTTRFLLKVGVVFLVAGGVFLHFLADLRGYWGANIKKAHMVGYGAALVVVASIVAGFFIMGSPAQVRLYRFDDQRVSDLQSIQWQVVNYWQQKEALPTLLADLEDPLSGYTLPRDPGGKDYEYIQKDRLVFELCANFDTEGRVGTDDKRVAYPSYDGSMSENWKHGVGITCFERTIDPQKYPPYEKRAPTAL